MTHSSFPQSPLSYAPLLVLCLLLVAFSHAPVAAQRSRAARAAPAKSSKPSKPTARTDKKAAAKKTPSRKETAAANKRGGKDARDKNRKSAADKRADAKKNDRRATSRTAKSDKRDDRDAKAKNGRALSKRERQAEAKRETARRAAERREAEQRRREEAARRAELARQARLAAIARARAAEQALRDETAANIANDDTTGEDLEVRRAAIAALGNLAGTVVVTDPMSGRVYSIVNQEWGVRRGFKPCSTIKLVTGLAGIENNIIAPTETVVAWNGRYRLDLTDSLAYSNNEYFQRVGGQVGFDRMLATAREFGLGQPTGINHARESAGRLPLFKTGYAVNHMSSHGDDFKVTPIQLAVMSSAIANGGNLLVPHLPRTPEENQFFRTEMRRRISAQPESLRRLVPGMIGAVSYGSAKLANDQMQTIGGKTGSCLDDGIWVGLFTSYAPVSDPRLAVAVVIKGNGARGKYAANVAGRVYRALNHRFGRRANAPSQLAIVPGGLAPRPKLNAAAAAAVSDEDREVEAATGDATTNANGVAMPGATTRGAAQGIQRVIKPVTTTRPVETTTRPANAPGTATNQSRVVAPGERPRRVLSTSP